MLYAMQRDMCAIGHRITKDVTFVKMFNASQIESMLYEPEQVAIPYLLFGFIVIANGAVALALTVTVNIFTIN